MNKITPGVGGWNVLKIDTSLFFIAHFSLQITRVEKIGRILLGKKGIRHEKMNFFFLTCTCVVTLSVYLFNYFTFFQVLIYKKFLKVSFRFFKKNIKAYMVSK